MSAPGTTPGPWVASVEAKPFPGGGHWYVINDSEENALGEFYGADEHESNVANLHLAAAAPELFEACSEALAFVEKMEGKFDKNFLVGGKLFEALRKARGEQS